MQSFVRVFTLAVLSAFLATSTFGAPTTAQTAGLVRRNVETASPIPAHNLARRHMSNAERMAHGLPPNPPQRRDGRLVARVSPTPVGANAPAPTPQSASICTPRTGIIEITAVDGSITGYLANVTTQFGQYGFSPNKEDAITVTAHCDGARFDLTTSDPNYPYLGGITGLQSVSADLLPGSANYAYFGGVTPTLPGKPACSQDSSFTKVTNISNTVESAIWSMDDVTGLLTAWWVNTSGDEQATHIAYSPEHEFFWFTGDVNEFSLKLSGGEQILEINLKLVSV